MFTSVTNRPRKPRGAWLVGAAAALLGVGCTSTVKTSAYTELQQQLDQSRLENAQLKQQVETQLASLQQQQQLIASLRHVGTDKLQQVNVVDRIEMATLTGGADYDGKPGDDGVTVYLRPVDAEGDTLKATGEITIKLVDNSGTEAPRLLGVYTLNKIDDIRKAWHSGFLTNHYTIKCPWQEGSEGLPRGSEVEIKATFLDYLTGKNFTANKVVKVTLAGESTNEP